MHNETALLSTIAIGLTLAFICGMAAVRLRLPALIGYLAAGVVIGPFTPGFVADAQIAQQLADIGVILLMFGVGMHFSVADLWQVRAVAIPGAITQIAIATALGGSLAISWGWSVANGLVFGLALSVASTVVLLRALRTEGQLGSQDGKIAVGWLVVEDLVTVLVLVVLPAVADRNAPGQSAGQADSFGAAAAGVTPLALTLAWTLAKMTLYVAAMLVIGIRLFPWVLRRVERTGSRELFTLGVATLSLGTAFLSAELFGVSYALGAFFAGVVVSGSSLSHRAAGQMRPLQDAFSALFFVAVGMLFDPAVLLGQPLRVLAVLGIIVLGKSAGAFAIVLAMRQPLRTALTVSAALAQVGEFSFILAEVAVRLGLLRREAQSLIMAGALLSIALNPLAFRLALGSQERKESKNARRS